MRGRVVLSKKLVMMGLKKLAMLDSLKANVQLHGVDTEQGQGGTVSMPADGLGGSGNEG